MIVFWRLLLAFFITDFVLFNHSGEKNAVEKRLSHSRTAGWLLHGGVFLLFGLGLCYGYLTMPWPFFGLVELSGWMCIVLFAVFHVFVDEFFRFGGKFRYGYLTTFIVEILLNVMFLFLCVPFLALYETGSFFAEGWVIFLVGLLGATRVLGWFIFAIEQDRYGRDSLTFDESWLMMMVRAIFFLIMLLPGWRWAVVLAVWFSACVFARRNRLMDVSSLAFYIGVIGSVLIGFLVRLRFYLV